MDKQIVEKDLIKLCSECGSSKKKTNFYCRSINGIFRKECIQCTNIKQKYMNLKVEKKINQLFWTKFSTEQRKNQRI